ncbi:MAG: asparagine synthase (glutamine-hydrolyzing) [Chitinophagaceae bacterium]|nr:MAG: asparagine synthase (glutamine-hydrolyzing) [Chitinophagaceae bacterium]
MCGINGIISDRPTGQLIELGIHKMNNSISHRGPDDDGVFYHPSEGYEIAMGIRRLSIIDLKTGHQPISNNDGSITIVFNGEIYNYKKLRRDLSNAGVKFNTTTDTEVVLKLYETKGANAFSALDGMFAYSIYDKRKNKIYIARDFFGEKPLYYTKNDGVFYWSSELKSIISVLPFTPGISNAGLTLFFQLTYIPAPFTIYENIFKLEANHYIEFDCQKQSLKIKEILQNNDIFPTVKENEIISLTHDLVWESVRSRSVSDVPIGAFLSGGVDSSIVSLCLSEQSSTPIDTFSIGFTKKEFDETDKSDLVAKLIGSHHHQFVISEKDLKNDLDRILLNFDEPFADSSSLAGFLVAQKTRQHVKVALTGDGGDEVFGGYNKYYMGKMNRIYTRYIPSSVHKKLDGGFHNLFRLREDNRGLKFKISRLLKSIDYSDAFYYNILSLGFQQKELNLLFRKEELLDNPLETYKAKMNHPPADIHDFREIDRLLSLEGDMLVKVDRTSMLNSLECRAPFLNKKLWDFTRQFPEHYLIRQWDKKYILKKAFKKYFPEGFLDKPKKGFGVPVGDWLRSDLKKELQHFTEKDFIRKQGIFQYDTISKLVNPHIEGKFDNTFRVWTFFCFQKWFSSVFKEKIVSA